MSCPLIILSSLTAKTALSTLLDSNLIAWGVYTMSFSFSWIAEHSKDFPTAESFWFLNEMSFRFKICFIFPKLLYGSFCGTSYMLRDLFGILLIVWALLCWTFIEFSKDANCPKPFSMALFGDFSIEFPTNELKCLSWGLIVWDNRLWQCSFGTARMSLN